MAAAVAQRSPAIDSWDSTLPGPPSRNNFGSADLSPSGLLAISSGSSVSVVDPRSLQLIATVPLPPSSVSSSAHSGLSPFVTSVRWLSLPLSAATDPSTSNHLLLAAGDRHGRIALVDLRLRSVVRWIDSSFDPKLGIQDMCWVQSRFDSYVLAAISGSSSLSLYRTSSGVSAGGEMFWKYDASPEYLSCLRRDPFDSRHFCAIGLSGFLLSVKVLGDTEKDILLKEIRIDTDSSELRKLERDAVDDGNSSSSSSPASAAFPLHGAKFSFSPHWKNILLVTFPRELVVFDLLYETALSSAPLPRGCAKFLDVLPDPNHKFLYCAHVDGKISIWRPKE